MKALPYRKIDAFTTGPSLGNPAACIYLDETQTLTDSELLDIAKQHKGFVSEVVYCKELSSSSYYLPSSYHLTYYSSECEVDFCGHGTIACLYTLIVKHPCLMRQKEFVFQPHKKGTLRVYNEVAAHDSVYITAPTPQYIGTSVERRHMAETLGVRLEAVSEALPLDVIDAGLRTLIVPISSLQEELTIWPDEQALKQFCVTEDIDIVLLFSNETRDRNNIAHTRVFAPRFGYLEDPATGSGNSAFGYYMLKNNLWDGAPVSVEQGGADRIFNLVCLQEREGRVLFGGRATTRIRGVYYL